MNALLAMVSALALSQQPTLAMAKRSAPSRIDASPHNFYGPMGRPPSEGTDLCMMCHVPNRLEWPKLVMQYGADVLDSTDQLLSLLPPLEEFELDAAAF